MFSFLIFALASLGSLLLLSECVPAVYRPAARAMRARAPKRLTETQVLINAISVRLLPLIQIDAIQRIRLAETMKSLGRSQSPEEFEAAAWAKGLLLAVGFAWLPLLSLPLGIGSMVLTCVAIHRREVHSLQREMAARRREIERELPQMAGTISQSLRTTHDVTGILASYRKICGPGLADEIDRTLNDMLTGNPEQALRSLESRVASPRLGQLLRGLISVLRGDDQRLYFQMLAAEYRKAQNEEITQELLLRPKQLNPNMGLLFGCLVLMIAASLGKDLLDQITILFA